MSNHHYLESRLRAIDWDFVSLRRDRSPFSRFHWYPGQLISQIPAALIGLLSDPSDLVIDPFAGSGSVVTEAQRMGRRALAIDINPISNMIIKAKTLCLNHSETLSLLDEIEKDIAEIAVTDLPLYEEDFKVKTYPRSVQVEKWYTRKVARSLNRFWHYCSLQQAEKKIVCDALFSSCLKSACRETRSWGYICDNVLPKDNPQNDTFVLQKSVSKALDSLRAGYRFREASASETLKCSNVDVKLGAANEVLDSILPSTAKLVVTSPPYLGVHDYTKAQRLSMEWFDFDISETRMKETGARSKRTRLTAREEYLTEMLAIFAQCHRVLVDGGWLCVVVGESKSRASSIAELCSRVEALGFKEQHRSEREIGNDRPQAPKLKKEDVIIWQK
jgi:DNA methylase